jgi:hypothetical protein
VAEKIQIQIDAKDDASKQLDHVADQAEKLEKLNPEVEVGADTREADRKLEDVTEQAKELSDRDVEIVLKARVDDLTGQLNKAKGDLDAVQDKAHQTERAVEDIGRKGATPSVNAIGDMTGPLGEASSKANELGQVFEGVGDLVTGLGPKIGLSVGATEKLAGAMGGVGLAVAAVAAVWGYVSSQQEKSKQKAEEVEKATRDAANAMEDVVAALQKGDRLTAMKNLAEDLQDVDTTGGDVLGTITRLGLSNEIANFVTKGTNELPVLDKMLDATKAKLNLEENAKWPTMPEEELTKLRAYRDELQNAHDKAVLLRGGTDDLGTATSTAGAFINDTAGELAGAATETENLTDRYKALNDELSKEEGFLDVKDAIDGAIQSAQDLYWANVNLKAGKITTNELEDAAREYEHSIIDAKQAVIDLANTYPNIPEEELTYVRTLIDQGKLDEAYTEMARIEANAMTPAVVPTVDTSKADLELAIWLGKQRELAIGIGALSFPDTRGDHDQYGGDQMVDRPTLFMAGEHGFPERVRVTPGVADPTASGMATGTAAAQTFTYNINLPKGTRGADLVRTMEDHARRNGARR